MNKMLNNKQFLWFFVLISQLIIAVAYVLAIQFRLINSSFFFFTSWILATLSVEFIYLLFQLRSKPDKTREFNASWLFWIGLIFVNFGIVLFFFTEFWFAGIFTLIPVSLFFLATSFSFVFMET
ncbi:MAG: hypothetical protein LAT67_00715 [Balneolales bacterium]|nr:hypothetical protein [Balneolales bacterium]